MFQMIEVVGTSGSGFSEAVKHAVDQITEKGYKVLVKLKVRASFE